MAPFSGAAQASILGRKERLDILNTALINGISSHVHDYDDTTPKNYIHPTSPVASALFAYASTHPVTGRRSLYLSSHAGGILGWPVPEARAFLRDLIEHATQRQFVYAHKWAVNDLVMWDNRQTMHRVRRYDQSQPRDMRRATVAGTAPTVAQQAAE